VTNQKRKEAEKKVFDKAEKIFKDGDNTDIAMLSLCVDKAFEDYIRREAKPKKSANRDSMSFEKDRTMNRLEELFKDGSDEERDILAAIIYKTRRNRKA